MQGPHWYQGWWGILGIRYPDWQYFFERRQLRSGWLQSKPPKAAVDSYMHQGIWLPLHLVQPHSQALETALHALGFVLGLLEPTEGH